MNSVRGSIVISDFTEEDFGKYTEKLVFSGTLIRRLSSGSTVKIAVRGTAIVSNRKHVNSVCHGRAAVDGVEGFVAYWPTLEIYVDRRTKRGCIFYPNK